MKVFSSIGHFFATVGHGIVKAAQVVVTKAPVIESDAQKAQPIVDAVLGVTLGPVAQQLERAAFQLFGNAVAVVSEAKDAVSASGLSVPLDAQLIADLKALAPQFEMLAASLGIGKPANVPLTAPAAVPAQ